MNNQINTLEIKNIEFKYNKKKEKQIINNVSFNLKGGDCLSILGQNGCGKSTLLKILAKIIKEDNGKIIINNKNIKEYSANETAKIIAYVPQNIEVSNNTVFDTILLGRIPFIKNNIKNNDLEIVNNIIKELNLDNLSLCNVNELSGGEIQKVAIARCLAQNPKILLLDEPTSNLDLNNQIKVINLIKKIAKENNLIIIISMHDINMSLRFSNLFLMMKNGMINYIGDESIITKESIKEVYDINVNIYNIDNKKIIIQGDN